MKLAEAEQHVRANRYFWFGRGAAEAGSKKPPGI
jgi:hypothetical protein